MNNTVHYLIMCIFPLICAFGVTALLGPVTIPFLHKLKFGQEIRDEGPSWHKKKSGTPTMGGIMFIIGIAVSVIAAYIMAFLKNNADNTLLLMLSISAGFGLVGFIDDYIKVVKKRNLGLRAWQKMSMQILFTVIYIVLSGCMNNFNPEILIPFTDIVWTIPMPVYVVFVLFVITGTVNAVNLTDGLDGLASSITIIVMLFFGICYAIAKNAGGAVFAAACAGGAAGFLIFNKYPAKVFMGDTGSLFLGGAVAVLALSLKMPLFLIIAGFVYFAETLSVIIQVASFKLTGKRVFKMSPIHHHFEMCGWKEIKIVTVFSAVTLILCIIAFLGFKA